MSATALADGQQVGRRIAEARRAAGLSQRTLAERLGISLWVLDEIERGRREPAAHLPAIAGLTDQPVEALRMPTVRPLAGDAVGAQDETASRQARMLVIGSIVALVVIRFFTEVVPVVPRAANFIDIPIFFALVLAAKQRAPAPMHGSAYIRLGPLVALFLLLSLVSAVLNVSRVEPGPFLVFIYGFLAPVGVYAAVYRLWPAGSALSLSRAFVFLGVVQFVVVGTSDLPEFIRTENPDVISGTFGTNAYQLVFFLLVLTGLVAGIFTFERRRLTAWASPMVFVLVFATVFLAQYRALLVATAVALILIGWLLGRRGGGVFAAIIAIAVFAITLSYVASAFPALKFTKTVATLQDDPTFYLVERFGVVSRVLRVYADQPQAIMVGTGPGTFSSRAWGTFALAGSESQSNVQGRYVLALTGGRIYSTDVSDKYIRDDPSSRRIIEGSGSVNSPFATYPSLLAEVGVFGLVLVLIIYFRAFAATIRMASKSVRFARPGESLPALLVASAVAFVLLLQMGTLHGNWLEVSRLTFLSWGLFAIVTKEYDARFGGDE